MAKYIKKETALKVVEKYGLTNGSTLGRHTGLAICIASEIADIPAADVAPVVHAQWIEDESGIIICPKCKRGYNLIAKFTNYCPACGAKMDGGDNNAAD
jgi:hypothetical protein